MSSGAKKNKAVKLEFTDDDICNMAFQSQINFEMNQALPEPEEIGHIGLGSFLINQLKGVDQEKLVS